MLRTGLIALVLALGTMRTVPAQSFTYEPIPIIAGSLSYYDLSTLAIQPPAATTYYSFTFTVNWIAGSGEPWSEEAMFSLTNGATPTVTYVAQISPFTGAAANANSTTLTWSGLLSSPYTSGTPLFIGSEQTYSGSVANWNSATLTLGPPPTPPTSTQTTLGGSLTTTLSAAQVLWYNFTVETSGSYTFSTTGTNIGPTNDTQLGLFNSLGVLIGDNDDIDITTSNLLSSLTITLDPGEYYLAASSYETTYADSFSASSISGNSGELTINGISTPVPEPSLLLLTVAGAFGLRRLRQSRKAC